MASAIRPETTLAITADNKALLGTMFTPDVATALWNEYGSLAAILDADAHALRRVLGVGEVTARGLCALRLLLERGARYATSATLPQYVSGPEDVALWARHRGIADSDREQFAALMLDTKNRILGLRVLSVGTLNSSIVHPREVFRAAIREGAQAICLVHNHPSGDTHPSQEDVQVTMRLLTASRIVGIGLLDHIIVGPRAGLYSMREDRQDLAWS